MNTNTKLHNKEASAKSLAYEAHHGQFRKYTGEPYIVHPEQVNAKVMAFCHDKKLPEKQKNLMDRASILHDVWEDCPEISMERIIAETDEDTFHLILELSNPSKGSTASRATRKKRDREHLASVSWEAKIIKLCDRILNLSDMCQCPQKDFIALYAKESRLLLEVLIGTDEGLESELLTAINNAEEWSRIV